MRVIFWLVTLFSTSTQLLHAQGNPRDFERPGPAAERQVYYAKVRTELNEFLIRWQRAWENDDARALASLYADEGSYYPAAAPSAHTRTAIRDYFSVFLQTVGSVQLQMLDFGTSGDLAFVTTRTTYNAQLPGSHSAQLARVDLLVLRRRSNGAWQIQTHFVQNDGVL
jgi:uncharacterized protein (TIGR02246 family)